MKEDCPGYVAQGERHVCANCGNSYDESMAFCPECGFPTDGKCRNCGSALLAGKQFCPGCGNRIIQSENPELIPKKRSKKKKWILLGILIFVVLAVAGTCIGLFLHHQMEEQKKQQAVQEYVANVEMLRSTLFSNGMKLETVGTAIEKNWNEYIFDTDYWSPKYYSMEDAVYTAQEEQSSNINSLKSDQSKVDKLYTAIIDIPDPENQDLVRLYEAADEMYQDYQSFYTCVIMVSGSYVDYRSELKSCDSNLTNSLKRVSNLLSAFDTGDTETESQAG